MGWRTTNLIAGMKDCVLFNLWKIELIVLGSKEHYTSNFLAAPTTSLRTIEQVPIPDVDKRRNNSLNILSVVWASPKMVSTDLELLKKFQNKYMQDHNSLYVKRTCLELKIFLSVKFLSVQLQLLSPVATAMVSSYVD